MNVQQMREYLMGRYSKTFAAKLAVMPDDQIVAIYHNTIERDRKRYKK